MKIKKNCLSCYKEFAVYPSHSKLKYCSVLCYTKSRFGKHRTEEEKVKISKTMKRLGIRPTYVARGSASNLWRGGVNERNKSLTRLIRDSLKYKHWRKTILERDDYTCGFCGERGGRLNVDHFPYAFSVILRSFRPVETIKQALELPFLWDTENGRTLCERCHIKNGNQEGIWTGGSVFTVFPKN